MAENKGRGQNTTGQGGSRPRSGNTSTPRSGASKASGPRRTSSGSTSKRSGSSKGRGKGGGGNGDSQLLRLIIVMTLAILVIYLTVSCNKVVETPKETPTTQEEGTTQVADEANVPQEENQESTTDGTVTEDNTSDTTKEDQTTVEPEAATEVTEEAVTTEEPTSEEDRPPLTDFSELDHSLDNTVFDDSLNPADLSNEKLSWWFKRNDDHTPVVGGTPTDFNMQDYGAYFRVNTDEKVVYLTFDNGYEHPARYTEQILDTLAANGVQGTFFVTQTYIRDNPDLVKRMKAEGHLVGNHTVHHKSSPDLTDEEFINELTETANYFTEVTGYEMDPFFRPPMGEYSERTLFLARKLGYRTIFWSLTYKDYDTENQPGKDYAYQHVIDNIHSGAIPLLHAVSSSNTEALDDIIKTLRDEGYRFGSLYEIE